jgi:RimJ/RimL family protein N-acetyltransferase
MERFTFVNYTDCTIEQLRDVFDLRNDPDMRKWAANPVELTWENHLSFVEKLKGDSKRIYLAIYLGNTLIGSYNLHYVDGTTWERGLFSSPAIQGKGLTTEWETQILDSLPRQEFHRIIAEVKTNNPRSIRYHDKMGFVETGRDENYVYYEKIL